MSATGRGRREGGVVGGPRSVTEIAVTALRGRILSGALAQGQHIGEQATADGLGVSRAALREALRVLERDGLVVTVPRAGSRVVTLSLRDAYEIVTLREHLERLAVEHGVPRPVPRALAAMERAVAGMELTATRGDESRAAADGVAFHLALLGLPGHRQLLAAFAVIEQPLGLLMGLNRRASARSESLADRAARHRRVLELVHDGDPLAVLAELGSHPTTGFLEAGVLPDDDADEAVLSWRAARTQRR
ncbi:GntR family transcriptional regulator [Mycetocola reblochoni]|uniref:Transcriptional regulator, GntR family n=2 Tax=Mycetocola reblochoni TaxID=331618 RepID=A0A1R4JI94_9MICO|nr:GntR family transcriptional regulator [Mycetocola reblochoni]RLP70517.1 GntR family transcriptional regulator [Mycetocola reblochoni]SJN31712.1 Transcriptional regulator, GntR family [Mycetocola reblochoni REB411]